jgi:hypothetical protein
MGDITSDLVETYIKASYLFTSKGLGFDWRNERSPNFEVGNNGVERKRQS